MTSELFSQFRVSILIGLVALISTNLVYLVYIYWFTDVSPGQGIGVFYRTALMLMLVSYAELENRQFKHVYHPFEMGLLMYLYWPFYLPYYFLKSRGFRGIMLFLGIILLLLAEWIVEIVWYVTTSNAA